VLDAFGLSLLRPLVGFLPSPSSGQLKIGPLTVNAYGLCIALGMAIGVTVCSRRWVRLGGSGDEVGRVATWAIPAGIIGARLYHLATDWRSYQGRWGDSLKIWEGGLGIWGGVALGTIVGVAVARRQQLALGPLLHAAAPAIPIAQAIGRWGNWFNVELFGRPSTLPWALEVPERYRPNALKAFATFHPTFLYESLWNLVIAIAIIAGGTWIVRRFRMGASFAFYVAAYTFGRFFIERIRVDSATRVGGIRVNEIVAPMVFVCALIALLLLRRKPEPGVP
jgi:prolipoprotein diacylglyceryl transferase